MSICQFEGLGFENTEKKQAFCCSIFANGAFRIEKIFQFLKRMIIAE